MLISAPDLPPLSEDLGPDRPGFSEQGHVEPLKEKPHETVSDTDTELLSVLCGETETE